MSAFSDLITKDLTVQTGKPRFQLVEDLIFSPEGFVRVIVPAGFITDFASIPRPLWGILPPIGSYDKAAVVHDWLYREGVSTRSYADSMLLLGMTLLQVSRKIRYPIYWGVRLGGGVTWNRYRMEEANGSR